MKLRNLLIAISAALALGQTPSPKTAAKFDVVSIRPVPKDAPNTLMFRQFDKGEVDVVRYPLHLLIYNALHARPFEVTGLPAWVATARYDIRANATEPVRAELMWPMFVADLEERFKMRFHREMQQKQVYELSVAKRGKLPVPDGKCWDPQGPPPAPVRTPLGQRPLIACGTTNEGRIAGGVELLFGAKIRMSDLVFSLKGVLGRPVVDKTGFLETFDAALRFARDDSVTGVGAAKDPTDAPGAPNIFTAIQEQMGLRLKSTKAPVEVIVIDKIEQPSEN